MPTYEVTDPETGRKLRLTGDSPPTEQELETILSQQPQTPKTGLQTESAIGRAGTFLQQFLPTKRDLGLTARWLAEGAAKGIEPITEPVRYTMMNAPVGGTTLLNIPSTSEGTSAILDRLGVPKPPPPSVMNDTQARIERMVSGVGSFGTSLATGAGMMNAATRVAQGVPLSIRSSQQAVAPSTPTGPRIPEGTSAPARRLMNEGIPLDRSQRTGGRFASMLRSATVNHPATVERAAQFSQRQQRAFNRAVLRSIGENADEATQDVMLSAKTRIGGIFDDVGKDGVIFDDTLQADLASVVDDALRTVPESARGPLARNVDDILNGVDDSGRIAGELLTKIRGRLSKLSRNPDVGDAAGDVEDALLEALQRTYPGQRRMLSDAVDQWRNMRIIEGAIAKGAERDISPLRLSNALSTQRNRAMSVYGQGGDQNLVQLSQAGRSVLPQTISDSGTVPRGLMQAPLRAVATWLPYRGVQNSLLREPPPFTGLSPYMAPVPFGVGNALSRRINSLDEQGVE